MIAGPTFAPMAKLMASFAGIPDLRIALYPGAFDLHSDAEIREALEKTVFAQIVDGLTKSLPKTTAAPTKKTTEQVVFRGELEEVNQFFFEKGWTDGLPIIPPTPDKVEQFLQFTDRSPDEEVTILQLSGLRATPRNIAANAIMAGCKPEHLPLLIAATEAIGDPDFQLMNLGSTGCKTPWLLVNGPIVKELGIDYGVAARSRGPNPALGRALGLIVNNIAGFKPGQTYMGTWGYYLPFVLAEDEGACAEVGWEPYHVAHGFNKEASTVTARSTAYWGSQGYPKGTDVIPILQCAVAHQEHMVVPYLTLFYGTRNMAAVLLTPPTAKIVARGGYSKRDVAEYIWQHARINGREANKHLQQFTGTGPDLHEYVQQGRLPKWFDIGPDETIPLLPDVNMIDVVVCGDPNRDKIMTLWCNYNHPISREVKMPANWKSLSGKG